MASIGARLDVTAPVGQGILAFISLPLSEGEGALELFDGVQLALGVGGPTTQHIINVHDDHAAHAKASQKVRWDCSKVKVRVEVTFANQEAAGIQWVLSQTHGTKLLHSSQIPRSRCVDLAIARLQQKHPGLRTSAQQLKAFRRKLDPKLACLRFTLQEGGGDV